MGSGGESGAVIGSPEAQGIHEDQDTMTRVSKIEVPELIPKLWEGHGIMPSEPAGPEEMNNSAPVPQSERSRFTDVEGQTPLPSISTVDCDGNDTLHGEAGSNWKVGPEDFSPLCCIGQGAFGRVLQVRSKIDNDVYAMKVISKRMLKKKNHLSYMRTERDIMTRIEFPFVVSLRFSFQTEEKLFLVMNYLAGGELFFHLRKQGLILEDTARFYVAEMVLALEHLHSLGIVHRDLKPENVLLGSDGHLCLTDFGLAKEITHEEDEESRTRTICGTSEYMAPEMITKKGYGKAVDWWALGALMYEMMAGCPPFRAKTLKDLNRKILNEKISMPKWLTSEAHAVLKGLLQRNITKRLGATKSNMFEVGGISALKGQRFFEKIDWQLLLRKQVAAPVIPASTDEADTSNFDQEFTRMDLSNSLIDIEGCGATHSDTFTGFSFIGSSIELPPTTPTHRNQPISQPSSKRKHKHKRPPACTAPSTEPPSPVVAANETAATLLTQATDRAEKEEQSHHTAQLLAAHVTSKDGGDLASRGRFFPETTVMTQLPPLEEEESPQAKHIGDAELDASTQQSTDDLCMRDKPDSVQPLAPPSMPPAPKPVQAQTTWIVTPDQTTSPLSFPRLLDKPATIRTPALDTCDFPALSQTHPSISHPLPTKEKEAQHIPTSSPPPTTPPLPSTHAHTSSWSSVVSKHHSIPVSTQAVLPFPPSSDSSTYTPAINQSANSPAKVASKSLHTSKVHTQQQDSTAMLKSTHEVIRENGFTLVASKKGKGKKGSVTEPRKDGLKRTVGVHR